MVSNSDRSTQASDGARLSRREFITGVAGAGVLAAAGTLPRKLWAQAAVAPKPPADPAGTVPNAVVLAEKNSALKRKDAKHAEERKGKYREMILTQLVIVIFASRLWLSSRT